MQGEIAAARRWVEAGLAGFRAAGDRWGVGRSLTVLGDIAIAQREYAAGRALQEEALAIQEACGDRLGVVRSLSALGAAALGLGDSRAARRHHERCVALLGELGDRAYLAYCLAGLAVGAAREGRARPAARLFGAGGPAGGARCGKTKQYILSMSCTRSVAYCFVLPGTDLLQQGAQPRTGAQADRADPPARPHGQPGQAVGQVRAVAQLPQQGDAPLVEPARARESPRPARRPQRGEHRIDAQPVAAGLLRWPAPPPAALRPAAATSRWAMAMSPRTVSDRPTPSGRQRPGSPPAPPRPTEARAAISPCIQRATPP